MGNVVGGCWRLLNVVGGCSRLLKAGKGEGQKSLVFADDFLALC